MTDVGSFGIAQPAGDVGEEHDLVGAELARDRAGGLVGVDVVGVALAVGADGRDDRDVVRRDVQQDVDVDLLDLPDEADVLAARRGLAAHAQQRAVVAAQPDRRLAVAVEAQDDVLVDLADEHHLRDLDRRLVGHAQAAHELDGHLQALHVGRDVGAAAVHDDGVHPDVLQEHDVAREVVDELGIGHRGAAVLDDDRAAVELPDVRERFEKGADVSHVVYSALIVTYSCPRSEKKTSVSAPSPGSVDLVLDLRAGGGRVQRVHVVGHRRAVAAQRDALDRDVERERRRRPAWPADGLRDPPPVRVGAVQRGLHERRVRDGARAALDVAVVAAAHDDAADPPGALAVAHDEDRELAQQRVERLAERELVVGLRRDVHAARARALEDRGVVRRELAVDGDAVERALDADAEQQVGGLGLQARVGLHEAEHRRERRLDHARALGLRAERDGARRQRHLERRALGERVGRHDRLG